MGWKSVCHMCGREADYAVLEDKIADGDSLQHVGICQQCRADAELGRLVRDALRRERFVSIHNLPRLLPKPGYGVILCSERMGPGRIGATIEEALKGGK
jgi:hypothetical protein